MRRRGEDGRRGAVLVEMALVLPILFTFVFGLTDFGLLVFERTMAAAGARDGARAAIVDYDQADVPASANNARITAAATARLHVRSPVVAIRCLDAGGAVIACSTATATVDRVELNVSWSRSAITFVGAIGGATQRVSATSAAVVSGRPQPAPSIPALTTTSSTTTTSTSTTTTTRPPTTTTTTAPCTVTQATVTPATNSLASSKGFLRNDFTVTVQTSGPCAGGIRLRLPNLGGPTTVVATGATPVFSLAVGRSQYKWAAGTATITVLSGSTGLALGNAVFVISG